MIRSVDVLIVGAGPCGMTAALALARAGVKAAIIDKRPHTREYSQAVVLWPRTLELLDLLGIVESWRDKSIPLHNFDISFGGKTTQLKLPPLDSPYSFPWCVGQDVTEAILQAELEKAGVAIERSTELIDVRLELTKAYASLQHANGTLTEVRSSWIVGAEGSHSLVREAANIELEGDQNVGVQLVQGDVRLRGNLTLAPGHGFLFNNDMGRALLILPASIDGHYRVLATLEDDGVKDAPTLEQLQSIVHESLPGVELYDPAWLNRFHTQHQLARTYRKGIALLVGDTAHTWVPIGGQGMNVGMQDAFDLGWKLGGVVRGTLQPAVLDTYTSERRPVGAATISYTETVYQTVVSPNSIGSELKRYLLPHVINSAYIADVVAKRLGQLDVHYPSSLVIRENGNFGKIKSGERAPDASVNRAGETERLFDLYRPGQWLVLTWLFDADDTKESPYRSTDFPELAKHVIIDCSLAGLPIAETGAIVLRDIGQLAASAFGVERSGIHVIRPDGIVGYRGSLDSRELLTYLEGIFV